MAGISFDTKEIDRFTTRLIRFADTPRGLIKQTQNALHNGSEEIAESAKKTHLFVTRSSKLENSIFVEVEKLTSLIFVPTEGALSVAYADWINTGKRRDGSGKIIATWNNGQGDPFIEKAYDRDFKKFLKVFEEDLTEGIDESI